MSFLFIYHYIYCLPFYLNIYTYNDNLYYTTIIDLIFYNYVYLIYYHYLNPLFLINYYLYFIYSLKIYHILYASYIITNPIYNKYINLLYFLYYLVFLEYVLYILPTIYNCLDFILTQPIKKNNKIIYCSICIEPIRYNSNYITLSCNKLHIFHKFCINKWYKYNKTCPLCREIIIF